LALLDSMPVAIFVIDHHANVHFANDRIAEMIGIPRDQLLGRNVLDFVSVADIDFVADLLDAGTRFSQVLMGPSRVRYLDVVGNEHWTQVWAHATPPELGLNGFVVTLTSESVRDVLATAVTSVAMEDPLDRTLAAVALAARALPFDGRGAILALDSGGADDAQRFRMIGDWPLDEAAINAFGTPWRQATVDGTDVDIDDVSISSLAPGARELLRSAGVAAMFVRPIRDASNEIAGVFVVFRREVGPATANQNDHLDDALRLAGLAFAQRRRRLELEHAAHRDALTGVANRAAFNERVRVERRPADVLFVDLDRFKAVNDTHGHDVGDKVIALAAKRLGSTVRRNDVVYRTGGDEFVVLCEETGADPAARIWLAERIIEQLSAPYDVGDLRVSIGATVGIAAIGDRSLVDTVRAADQSLYRAKDAGRARWAHDGA
jgi:diguanylate cyclase (GGDEF)-like protein/PAS domain S-box-containing protein